MTDTFKIAISRYQLDKKIPSDSDFWPKFNASFLNCDITDLDLLTEIYDGRSITTWHKNNWRSSANFELGQHIGLDFDTGDKFSTIEYLKKDKFIAKYASFLYTTISHTPENPRARVIFLLDKPIQQAKNYSAAATALLWLFGTADKQCKDAVRFFYGSKNCQAEYVGEVLPLDVLKETIAKHTESEKLEKKPIKQYDEPVSQKEASEALRTIPPWGITYEEWVMVLMGIHNEFGDAGYMLAESWASGKPGEVERKWKSFKDNGNTSGAVTIGTVFGIAKNFGWKKVLDNAK